MIKRHFKLEFQRAGKLPVLKGTTTIGVVCHDGVVLTTDTRATMGSFVAHKHAKKVYRSEEHTSELQSQSNLVCRLLLEKKKQQPALVRRRRGLRPIAPRSLGSTRLPA